jgi:23S rRNA pseudouridine2605 synthase
MNPENKVAKTYQVKTATKLNETQIEQLRRGRGTDRRAHAASHRYDTAGDAEIPAAGTSDYGGPEPVRRMIEAVGSKVLKLVRAAIGPIRIGDLPIGNGGN